jgi:hypothetical protein
MDLNQIVQQNIWWLMLIFVWSTAWKAWALWTVLRMLLHNWHHSHRWHLRQRHGRRHDVAQAVVHRPLRIGRRALRPRRPDRLQGLGTAWVYWGGR